MFLQRDKKRFQGTKRPIWRDISFLCHPIIALIKAQVCDNNCIKFFFNIFQTEAVDQISKVALHINENIRQHENFQKMLSIQNSFSREDAPKLLSPGKFIISFKLMLVLYKYYLPLHEQPANVKMT